MKEADHVVMIDGCFLQCIGRVVNNLVDENKIVHVDALSLYHKYTDLFDMDDVPESERIETARQAADQILAAPRQAGEPARPAEEESAPADKAAASA